jgi:hypothetical protein
MKLSDGSKVKMHESPHCEERDRLSSEWSRLLAEWLAWRDEVKQTNKNDRSYRLKVAQMNEIKRSLRGARKKLTEHAIKDHGCW